VDDATRLAAATWRYRGEALLAFQFAAMSHATITQAHDGVAADRARIVATLASPSPDRK
jgi:hypothetical protein